MTSPANAAGMGQAGIGLAGIGAVTNAYGTYESGQAQSKMYGYQAGLAQYNAQIDKQNADYAMAAGEQSAAKYGMGARFQAGKIVAAQSASGIAIGGGSAADVVAGQKTVTDIDMATIRNNAARTAYGYETKAVSDTAQAGIYSAASANASAAGKIGAIGSLISGAGSVATKWSQYGQTFGGAGGGQLNTDAGDPSAGGTYLTGG